MNEYPIRHVARMAVRGFRRRLARMVGVDLPMWSHRIAPRYMATYRNKTVAAFTCRVVFELNAPGCDNWNEPRDPASIASATLVLGNQQIDITDQIADEVVGELWVEAKNREAAQAEESAKAEVDARRYRLAGAL